MAKPTETPKEDSSKKVIEYLEAKWIGLKSCPICTNSTWNAGQQASVPVGPGMVLGPHYPLFPISCTTCGYTFFINALVAGLAESPNPSGEESAS
jgi:hypothetical protein